MKYLSAALLLCIGSFLVAGDVPRRTPGLSIDMEHSLQSASNQERLRPVPELDLNVRTGPAVGSKIPEFQARDQQNRKHDFESLRGPKGLLLLFYRSADW
jgi:hypothetical protein